jgi:peroxin-16
LVIILIEAAKTLARLYMLFSNRGNILVLGTDNEDVEPPAQLDAAAGRLPPEIPFRDILQLYASRGRGVHNPHGSFTEFTKPPVPPEQSWAPFHIAAAESLNILRPTVYAIARYVCADQSWKPFFLSLLVDGSSRYLIGDLAALTRDQQQEIARRMLLWAFYLLRTPFFDNFTKKHLSTVLGFLGRIPLLGIVFGNLLDLALELQAHHFYTSASSS